MSDRLLIAGGSVPMLCGLVALVLLQRAPGIHAGRAQAAEATYGARATQRSDTKRWIGVVVAGSTAELAANASGRVDAVFVRSGARVKRGDRLLQFDVTDSTNSVGMANAELSQRVSDVTRLQARALAASTQWSRLREGETWLSKQELDTAAAEARMAEAELQAARGAVGASRLQLRQARVRATRQTLTAPFAGLVVALDVDAGGSVTAGQIVVRISSDDRQVRFAFPPGELPAAGEQRVSVQLSGTEHVVQTSVSAVRPELDPSAQLVFATAPLPVALPEAERWIPGAAVQVRSNADE
ncbi:MAG TPA: biotin/lipoyl-binding protein [Polyangiales bacterium]|nr:biotin/lipoyl-binding protein [Polyangiales bacterium]